MAQINCSVCNKPMNIDGPSGEAYIAQGTTVKHPYDCTKTQTP